MSENVFEAADALLVPIIPATLSSRTLDQLHQVLSGGPQVLGFFSMADRRKKLHRELMAELANEHDLLETVIPNSADVERMGARRAALVDFAPRSRAARAYTDLWARDQGASGRPGVAPRPASQYSTQVASRSRCASGSDSSFLSVWFSICRMRSRVTLNARPTSSSV